MSALKRAYTIEEITEDESLVEGATKLCFTCDPDNPRSVARNKCPTCKGTGRQALGLSVVIGELKASKNERKKGGKGSRPAEYDEDLFLEG